MSNFKEAAKLKLRFITSKGMLNVEQLWNLSMTALAVIVRSLKKEIIKDDNDGLSFLDDTTVVDKTMQLRFDIAKELYLDKKAAYEAEKNKSANKLHNEKIDELIFAKQNEELATKSIDELQKLKKEV